MSNNKMLFSQEQIEFLKTLINDCIYKKNKSTLPITSAMSAKEKQSLYNKRWRENVKNRETIRKVQREYYLRKKAKKSEAEKEIFLPIVITDNQDNPTNNELSTELNI